MRFDVAQHSLIGHRDDNQDRVGVLAAPRAVFALAIDGMGGHREGGRAAEAVVGSLQRAFRAGVWPLADPPRFLCRSLEQAHADVVSLGAGLPFDARPRATCALALVQDDAAWWAHAGDSRVYLLRDGQVRERTRDHTRVERMRRQGLIEERQLARHPQRHMVESCLGGEPMLPELQVSRGHGLRPGDVLLLCTDGFWSALHEDELTGLNTVARDEFSDRLLRLTEQAVATAAPRADNTSVCALRWWES